MTFDEWLEKVEVTYPSDEEIQLMKDLHGVDPKEEINKMLKTEYQRYLEENDMT
jgi:hypothetical protein